MTTILVLQKVDVALFGRLQTYHAIPMYLLCSYKITDQTNY